MDSFNVLRSSLSRANNVISRLPYDIGKNIMRDVLVDDWRFYPAPPISYLPQEFSTHEYWESQFGTKPREVEIPSSLDEMGPGGLLVHVMI